jgi:hypothetical protein
MDERSRLSPSVAGRLELEFASHVRGSKSRSFPVTKYARPMERFKPAFEAAPPRGMSPLLNDHAGIHAPESCSSSSTKEQGYTLMSRVTASDASPSSSETALSRGIQDSVTSGSTASRATLSPKLPRQHNRPVRFRSRDVICCSISPPCAPALPPCSAIARSGPSAE